MFYYFRLEDQIPEHHLLRRIDRYVDFRFVRERLREAYSAMGRPSIDPEILLRILLVGYLYGITSERRLVEEVRMHLAYRWFTRLGFEQEIPDHSTFSKNRHGRFRDSGIFLEVFEEIVRRCLEAGLVEGKRLTVDGTVVAANASPQRGTKPEQLKEVAKISRTVREYLADLAQENPLAEQEENAPAHDCGRTLYLHNGPRRLLGGQTGSGGSFLLRSLPDRQCQLRDSACAGDAGTISARDISSPPDARAGERATRRLPRESGSGQGLRQWRIPRLAAGAEHPTAHSGDRSAPSNTSSLHARPVPV
jgi:transposase